MCTCTDNLEEVLRNICKISKNQFHKTQYNRVKQDVEYIEPLTHPKHKQLHQLRPGVKKRTRFAMDYLSTDGQLFKFDDFDVSGNW